MEKSSVIKFDANLNDTIWLCPTYHGRPYQRKKQPTVIILESLIFGAPDNFIFVGNIGNGNTMLDSRTMQRLYFFAGVNRRTDR